MYKLFVIAAVLAVSYAAPSPGLVAPVIPLATSHHSVVKTSIVHPVPVVHAAPVVHTVPVVKTYHHAPIVHAPVVHAPIVHAPVVPVVKTLPVVHHHSPAVIVH